MATRTSTRINGRDLMLFEVQDNGEKKPTGGAFNCAESCEVNITTNFTELGDKDTSAFNEAEIDNITWDCSTSNMMSSWEDYNRLLKKQINGEDIWIRFSPVSNPTDDEVKKATPDGKWAFKGDQGIYGKCKIQSIKITAPAKGKATYTCTFKGSGKIYIANPG